MKRNRATKPKPKSFISEEFDMNQCMIPLWAINIGQIQQLKYLLLKSYVGKFLFFEKKCKICSVAFFWAN